MNLRCCAVLLRGGNLFFLFYLGLAGVQAQTKYIRLRNQLIATAPRSESAFHPLVQEAPVSGLFLLQLDGPLQRAWRDELRAQGVQLLRYVPDDAFVVRFDQVRLSQVRSLSFVRWAGPYQAGYKIYAGLLAMRGAGVLTNQMAVRLLLAPDAPAAAVLQTRQALTRGRLEAQMRFGAVLQGSATQSQIAALAQSPEVLWIEPAPHPRLFDEVSSKIVGGQNETDGHPTATQELGFDGGGVVVSVADSGLDNGDAATMHPDLMGRVDKFMYYGSLTDAADEHSHGTHVAGIIAGNGATGETDENGALYGLGVAPGAHLVAQRIFDGEGNYEAPPSNEVLTHDAVRAGAVIGSNSWGDDTQGRYDLNAAEFDALVRDADADTPDDQPYILEFSAGNAGPGGQTIGSPAVAKNVIATGASENDRTDLYIYTDGPDTMADFSSRGPCEDGRIKPDVVAPGTWIASLQSASATDQYAWLPISANYQYQGGTSQAGPHVSGAAAVFVQYYRETHTNSMPSPALVKAALINSSVPLDLAAGNDPVPNQDEGWGRVDLTEMIGSPRRYDFLDQTVLLATSQTYERQVVVGSSDEPLKITMAYTDVPGLPAAIPALVNDLDLVVIGPDGRVYRGNQFDGGESVPDATASDSLNNVEGVYLETPMPGEYRVQIEARNVVEDACLNTPAIDQDFALVISGDLPIPGVGVVVMDRTAYTVPAVIKLKLIDFDLAGDGSARVQVTSATQTNGLTLTLQADGPGGVFTGSVATVTGPVVADGNLHVGNGDLIQASYQDASPEAVRTATARADLVPPIITGITVTNQFGKVIISWQTDEPATGQVRYGTNTDYLIAGSGLTSGLTHEVTLENLPDGVTNWFMVVSTDAAGNTATNDNNGQLYTFVATAAATVLLVNQYESDGFTDDIPITVYTDALDQSKVAYEVWDFTQMGRLPTTNDLQPFRVVIWRLNDSPYSSQSVDAPEQAALQDYLDGGGSLFIASMELLSRLGDVPFRTNVLQVQAFAEDVTVPSVTGFDFDPITSGMSIALDYSAYPSIDFFGIGPDFSDTITPTTNAAPIFLEDSSGQPAGLRYPRTGQDSPGRVVFLSFPLDAVPLSGAAPNNRANLLANIVNFLAPGVNGLGTIALDNTVYTIPAQVTVEVGDSDLAGQGQALVKFYSDIETNGQTVVLNETARRGLFRGFITVASATNEVQTGQVRVQPGGHLWAEYFDASANSLVRVYATIDTVPPAIANVASTPDYSDAVVDWDTSKPSDALVQFGESTFLGRTAYSGELTTHHELQLVGLLPDRQYYFQVVSRDQAGNAMVDDDQGKFFVFQTLKPVAVPWVDSLDTGQTNWTVLDGEAGTSTWQLGIPNNGQETAAHSPPNAWGSNLNGDVIDLGDTSLISPAIDLSGGNQATLSFWQSYDFTSHSDLDIYEYGEVNITTNNGAVWTPLIDLSDSSAGWEEQQIDLTPYIGSVIRLGWYYGLFSLDNLARPGWLVDDVSVTVTNIPHGTIEVTNNLAQAGFAITGPVSVTGRGWDFVVTNAPLGRYTVTYQAVPFYQSPTMQTNTLEGTNTVVFTGNYTIVDTNQNGIPDAWEQTYFGDVSSLRTQATDTDGDGMTDYAEFTAGTNPTNSSSFLWLSPPVLGPDQKLQ
ncbi:MAG: S8 family serine peptidase, partial [Candidatus Omnitrophica bacterium]|nr:S8 family serine peptidase [Candidatus Omnitrophota bacterium]